MAHESDTPSLLVKPPPVYSPQDDRVLSVDEVDLLLDQDIHPYPPGYVHPFDPNQQQWNTIERALEDLSTHKPSSQSIYYVPRNTSPVTNPNDLFTKELDGYEDFLSPAHGKDSLVPAYFFALSLGRTDLVERLLQSNLVDANTTGGPPVAGLKSTHGMTPLLAAVMFKKRSMVVKLMEYGSHIDGWGLIPVAEIDTERRKWQGMARTSRDRYVARTPLQLAASQGDLPMVKLLLEQYGANDSLIAPDGQLALRLAADARHRHVVAYLPSRKGGAILRLKEQWRVSFAKVKHILNQFCKVARTVVWDCPKFMLVNCVIYPIKKVILWCWRNKQCFGPWCVKTVRDFGTKVVKEVRDLGTNMVKGVKWITQAIRRLPGKVWWLLREIYLDLVRIMRRIPRACHYVGRFLRSSCIAIFRSLQRIVLQTAAFLHTAFWAICSFFRHLTLIDIWNGICDILHAVFISFPKVLASVLKSAWDAFGAVLCELFGIFGCLLHLLLSIPLQIARWIGSQIWKMLAAFGSVLRRIANEVRIWWNPKAC